MNINLYYRGVIYCTKAVIDYIISRQSDKIISMYSIGGRMGSAHAVILNGDKAGVIGFTKSLATRV
jgi:short-subunit dehydrogenase